MIWIKDAATSVKAPEEAPQQENALDFEQQDVKKGEQEEQVPMVDTASSPVSGEITSPKVKQSQRPGPRGTFGDQTPMVRRDLLYEERLRRNNEYIERLRQDPDSKTSRDTLGQSSRTGTITNSDNSNLESCSIPNRPYLPYRVLAAIGPRVYTHQLVRTK